MLSGKQRRLCKYHATTKMPDHKQQKISTAIHSCLVGVIPAVNVPHVHQGCLVCHRCHEEAFDAGVDCVFVRRRELEGFFNMVIAVLLRIEPNKLYPGVNIKYQRRVLYMQDSRDHAV